MRAWLDASELRVGLGCMRLTDEAPIVAAAEAGITVFDTARSYGESERLLASALRGSALPARIVTKGGMGAGWIPDGRAKTIRADCEKSLDALGGLPVDLYLLHAPDPRTPWATSVRALAKLVDDGLVARIGLSNVNHPQLDAALEIAPIAAVEVALSRFDDRALRGGMVARCRELGIAVIAHSPLGGPRRAHKLNPDEAEEALAWVLALGPEVVAIPGATRVKTARSAARAASLKLVATGPVKPRAATREGEVVVVMGIPGAGKSRISTGFLARGYRRLNRDELGGTLKDLAATLDAQLAAGEGRVVLDNTYLTRASRSHVIDVAHRHGLAARCVWLDISLAQAQINLVERLLDHFGRLPQPEELRGSREPGLLLPTSQMRARRELEPPTSDEGWNSIEQVPFVREPSRGQPGVLIAAAAVTPDYRRTSEPHLVFDWNPAGDRELLERAVAAIGGDVESALCAHAAGPPQCWCRPPLPGLLLAFARAKGVDPARSLVIGTGPAHRTLADALGGRYRSVSDAAKSSLSLVGRAAITARGSSRRG
ncbi:MAG TPA: aldo/keto reductase [Frankiaceae bacterium]|nr:aldo/keto reductase [Frankiaceae bacterium]